MGLDMSRFVIFVSDAESYNMIKYRKCLNTLYSKMIRVTCAVHGLNRVSEEVRVQLATVDKIIVNVKQIFKKVPAHIQIFKDYTHGYPSTSRTHHNPLEYLD